MPDINLSDPTEEQVLGGLWRAVQTGGPSAAPFFPPSGDFIFTGGSKIDHRSFKLEFEDGDRNRLDFVVYVVKSGSIYEKVS